MSTIQQIKRRINGIKSTIKVTKVMQLVAAGKFRSMKTFMSSVERFYSSSNAFLLSVMSAAKDSSAYEKLLRQISYLYPFLLSQSLQTESKQLILIFGSNRGLCGNLNTAVFKMLINEIRNLPDKQLEIYCVGENINQLVSSWCKRNDKNIKITSIFSTDNLSQFHITAREITNQILSNASNAGWTEVKIYYTHFASSLLQFAKKKDFVTNSLNVDNEHVPPYLIDGDVIEQFKVAVDRFCVATIEYVLRHTLVSEQAMRMRIMDSATNNGNKAITNLLLHFNKMRQASITNELIDIISAANAIK